MERKIGEVFEEDGVKVQCIEDESKRSCLDCFFEHLECWNIPCSDKQRMDKRSVIFKELKD